MVKVDPAATGFTKVVLGPCHYRAIHSGHDRSRADNHGQRHGALDLRRFPTSQVTTSPDLALGAGVAGSNPAVPTTSENSLLSRGTDGPSLG
jgi:hypothetical protein